MLFNSYIFVFAFFPASLLLYHLLAARGWTRAAHVAIVASSVFFYAWWDWRFVGLLAASVAANYTLGLAIERGRAKRLFLAGGIAANLAVLGGFKYLGFFVANLDAWFGAGIGIGAIILPLGISFFTFEQIGYLVDVNRGTRAERDFLHYSFFVVFFPRLVAGPILRASEILPQLRDVGRQAARHQDIAIGLTIFALGLCKKTFLADGIAPYANDVFAAAARGESLDLLRAWTGALAYTLQLYFDFSGYSDMAIGIARCFGITLPLNFFSPYKARSIIEFWRCWHMTLSRFLRDYLYIPLGGSRTGTVRRYVNLMLTMLLGGLWHGASWSFVAWGGLHGGYLVTNHLWRNVASRAPRLAAAQETRLGQILCWAVTFLAVIVAWVFFRASDFTSGFAMLRAMAGQNGIALPSGFAAMAGSFAPIIDLLHIRFDDSSGTALIMSVEWIVVLMAIVLFLPNVAQLMARVEPALDMPKLGYSWLAQRFAWQGSRFWACAAALAGVIGVLSISRAGEFLYWRF